MNENEIQSFAIGIWKKILNHFFISREFDSNKNALQNIHIQDILEFAYN